MKPIHPISAVSEDHAFVALMSIANSHNLNYASISDIINLISGLLPSPNVFLQTNLRSLINKYVNIEDIMTKHSCCAACMDLLPLGGASNTCGRHGCIGTEKRKLFFLKFLLKNNSKSTLKVFYVAQHGTCMCTCINMFSIVTLLCRPQICQ